MVSVRLYRHHRPKTSIGAPGLLAEGVPGASRRCRTICARRASCAIGWRANARLAAQARTDPLTGLLNHGAIGERTDATIGDAATRREIVSLRFFGIDHFKRINDTHGHQAVDAVLAAVARRASASLRAGDTVGRYGGEKFLVLLPATGATGALGVAERLRQAIAAEPFTLRAGGRSP